MCCGDKKSRIHPGNQSVPFVRVNGLTKPLHYLQVIAWIILFLFGLVYFGVIAIAISDPWKPVAYVIVGLLFIVHMVTHAIATAINPADENARLQIESNHQVPAFDRTKHEHVIENEYCNLCETYVKKTSKHCRACNKCVADFDHHCLWLNNCVGGINYKYFFTTITSAFLGTLTMEALTLFVFINSFIEFNMLDKDVWWRYAALEVFQAILAILIVLYLLASVLLGQLVFFHVYLYGKKMTTYEYIQHRRSKEESHTVNNTNNNPSIAEEEATACAPPPTAAEVADRARFSVESDTDKTTVPVVKLGTADEVEARFTNAAFSNDESQNTNGNSNAPRRLVVADDIPSVASSLGELTAWNKEPDTIRGNSPSRLAVNGDYLRHRLQDDALRKSSPVPDGKRRHSKRKRSHKKLTAADDGPSRPLPMLPENSNPPQPGEHFGRKTVLPPLRKSADWVSSAEDLRSNYSSRRKLPSLTPSSSVNSFASFASGSVSTRPSELYYPN